ncbi:unnamed protein product [Schistosoma margrebowiei]|uniref:Kinesin-like protein n=1 Tax=Schistosoma margrebowiei TaxID=48269 RepID=A0A183MF87_9TREM|nr:unnamed protein product [Schistosoma margrebowiei]
MEEYTSRSPHSTLLRDRQTRPLELKDKYNIDDLTHHHHQQQQQQQHQGQRQQFKRPKITFECTRNTQQDEVVCNRKEFYNFQFDAIFDTKVGQDQVFNDVAKRVTLFEHTEAGTIHLKNLSIHSASTTDEALNLLFMGDTNRIIAETPMNEASTRSHCIFTIHITSRPHGSSVIRRSKLHLVDLAGSERVYKCGLDGTLLTEAKYINLSLHYLEQVIIALAEKQRTHVPYRNSMMTMMLRDSLGGNCMTSMIATCSIEQENLQETISTCRFAQRVALIKNEITLNEEQDPYLTINHLKSEIEHLKAELAFATGIEKDATLNAEDKEKCEKLIQEFLNTPSTNEEVCVPAPILSNIHMINFGFSVMHAFYWKNIKKFESIKASAKQVVVPSLPNATKEANQLREILAQRDHEIRVLIKLLKQQKQKSIPKNYSPHAYTNTNVQNHDDNRDTYSQCIENTLTTESCKIQNKSNIEEHKTLRTPQKNTLLDESKRAVDHVTKWLEQQVKGKLPLVRID